MSKESQTATDGLSILAPMQSMAPDDAVVAAFIAGFRGRTFITMLRPELGQEETEVSGVL